MIVMKKMISTYQSILAMGLLIIMVACAEVIDLGTENNVGGQVVIFGRITNGTQGNELIISRTGFLGQQPIPVSGAVVTLHDSQGVIGNYQSDNEGNYTLTSDIPVARPGESYYVRVEFSGGDTYESKPEVMPTLAAKDSLYFNVQEIEETSDQGVTSTRFVVSVLSDTEIFDPRPDLFIKWDLDEVYTFEQAVLPMHNFPFYVRNICYITNELEQQRIQLYDGSELRATSINGFQQTDRSIDETFRGVHYFNLVQQSITKEAHLFWSGLDQNINRVGSIFDQPPGRLTTNLYNVDDPTQEVLGYFVVSAADTTHLKVTNSQLNQFFPDPCPKNAEVDFAPFMAFWFIERYYEPECLNCLTLRNSNLNRPSYFD